MLLCLSKLFVFQTADVQMPVYQERFLLYNDVKNRFVCSSEEWELSFHWHEINESLKMNICFYLPAILSQWSSRNKEKSLKTGWTTRASFHFSEVLCFRQRETRTLPTAVTYWCETETWQTQTFHWMREMEVFSLGGSWASPTTSLLLGYNNHRCHQNSSVCTSVLGSKFGSVFG